MGKRAEKLSEWLPKSTVGWAGERIVEVEGVTRVTVCKIDVLTGYPTEPSTPGHEFLKAKLEAASTLTNPEIAVAGIAGLDFHADGETLSCNSMIEFFDTAYIVRMDYGQETAWLLTNEFCYYAALSNGQSHASTRDRQVLGTLAKATRQGFWS